MKKLRALLLVVLTFAYLIAGGLPGSSVVCIEADGSITIESRGTTCCSGVVVASGDTAENLFLAPSGSSSGCDSCTDITIPTITADTKTTTKTTSEAKLAAHVLAFTHTAFVPTPPKVVVRVERTAPQATLRTNLCTVSLRC